MTIWDLLKVCRRRWPILLVGLVLTGASLVVVRGAPGVYSAQSDVVFFAPKSTRYPNSLGTGSESLIDTAGLIEREISKGAEGPATSSSSVTLVDQGVRSGTDIRLPSAGGQWAYNFNRPVLDIQAVDSDPAAVRSRMAELQDSIIHALAKRQDNAHVDPINRISLQSFPSVPDVIYSGGDRKRASAVDLLLGIGLTLGAAAAWDRWARNRPQRRAARRRILQGDQTSVESDPILLPV